MPSYGDNIEIKNNDIVDKVVQELFQSLISKYENDLEKSIKGSGFIFDCIHVLNCKCHKVNLKLGRSYIDSPN